MRKLYTLVVSIAMAMVSCAPKEDEFHHHMINFLNESDQMLYIDRNTSFSKEQNFESVLHQGGMTKSKPNTINQAALNLATHGTWESRFLNYFDTLWVYVLDAEKIENAIYDYDAVLQCYGLTLNDLRKLNWVVTYPPNEAMKDIKMYPAYMETTKDSDVHSAKSQE